MAWHFSELGEIAEKFGIVSVSRKRMLSVPWLQADDALSTSCGPKASSMEAMGRSVGNVFAVATWQALAGDSPP